MGTARRAVAALALVTGFAAAAAPASDDIRINEIESQDAGGGNDWVELTNTGPAAVDIGGYVLRDSRQANLVADEQGAKDAATSR